MGQSAFTANKPEDVVCNGVEKATALSPHLSDLDKESLQKLMNSLPIDDVKADDFHEALSSDISKFSDPLWAAITHDLAADSTINRTKLEEMIVKTFRKHVLSWDSLNGLGIPSNVVLSIATGAYLPSIEHTDSKDLIVTFPSAPAAFQRNVIPAMVGGVHSAAPTIANSEILSTTTSTLLQLMFPSIASPPTKIGDLLFSLKANGTSYRALSWALRYYSGDVIIVIKDTKQRIFGAYSARKWSETISTTSQYDNSDGARRTALWQLEPTIRVRRATCRGAENCVYFNVGNSFNPHGIGFGGKQHHFRLWISSDLKEVHSVASDATYEDGQLLDPEDDEYRPDYLEVVSDIENIEIWGCAGPGSKAAQEEMRMNEAELRQDRRSIDRSRLISTDFDKEVMFAKTFAHARESREEPQPRDLE